MPRMNESEFTRRVMSMGYTWQEARRLFEIAKECVLPAAVVGGTTGFVGTGGNPYGILAGFILGEIACIAGWGNVRKALDEILESTPK